jgi:large repetitive protein
MNANIKYEIFNTSLIYLSLSLFSLSIIACDDEESGGDEGGAPVVRAGSEAGSEAGDEAGVMAGDQAGTMGGGMAGTMGGGMAGTTPIIECGDLPDVPMGECSFIPAEQGPARNLLIQGTILTADDALENGAALVDLSQDNGTFLCVGCDCEAMADASTARLICPDAVVSPGLINPHDHLGWATANPVAPPQGERYEHRHDWRKGKRGHTQLSAGGSDNSASAVLVGELRMLMSGATSIAGSSNTEGLLRNLDDAQDNGGLGSNYADYRTFPLGDNRGGLHADGCNEYDIDDESRLNSHIYLPHVSEGIDPEAQNEFACLSGSVTGSSDLLAANTSIIHGIGLTPGDILSVAGEGAKLVWSPRSNVQLYGHTASVVSYKNAGVTISIGTDWIPSGSMNMLRELHCADLLNANNLGSAFSDRELWQMATKNGAIALGVSDQLGYIEEGYIADLVIYQAGGRDPYRAVLEATPERVSLVMRGGVSLYGDESIINGLGSQGCETDDVCGVNKSICSQADAGVAYSTLKAYVSQGAYPLFFCGEPEDEPSCLPFREGEFTGMSQPDDQDGDGVIDAMDNCPTVFNAPRPLEGELQGDIDQDGVGDACDRCPLNEGEDCAAFDPDDTDGDMVEDRIDNCPGLSNPEQNDQDEDMIGDLCDICPQDSNLNGAGCPSSIYAIKRGMVSGAVEVSGVVTAAQAEGRGFFMQVPNAEPEYEGVDDSAIYVYTGNANEGLVLPTQGQFVSVSGTPSDFYGQLQITDISAISLIAEASDAPTIEPTTVTAAEVGPDGARSQALEGALIELLNVEVTAVDLEAGPGDRAPTNEFQIDNALVVNDLFYLIEPAPSVGQTFQRIAGTLRFANSAFKVEPRGIQDIGQGPVSVVGFSSQQALSVVGQSAPLSNLEGDVIILTLSGVAPAGGEQVTLTTSPSGILDVANTINVPEGQYQVMIEAEGLRSGETTLTANITGRGGESINVEVIEANTSPTELNITPNNILLGAGGSSVVLVTFNYPAPANYVLSISVDNSSLVNAPQSIDVDQGARSASIMLSASNGAGMTTLNVSADGATAQANITISDVPLGGEIVINELESNQPSTDTAEFIELYNASNSPLNLSDYRLEMINGSSGDTYRTVELSELGDTLAPRQFLVLANAGVMVDSSALTGVLPSNGLQNGSPDGVRVVNTSTGDTVDSLSYGSGTIDGVTEGMSAENDIGAGTLARCTDGADSDDNSVDFTITQTATPGSSNICN